MNKLTTSVVVVTLMMLLGACGTTRVVREPYGVPTPIVPHPPTTERPITELDKLPIRDPQTMTEVEKGEYIKAYRLTALQWKQYSLLLEAIVKRYELAAVKSDEAREILETEIAKLSAEALEIVRQIEVRKETTSDQPN